MPSPLFKPGDLVRTPSGRTAVVDDLCADGRREIRFVDQDRGFAALRPEFLRLVAAAPVVPWRKRVLR